MNMSIVGKMIGLRADTVVSAVVEGSLTIALVIAFLSNVGFPLLKLGIGYFIIFMLLMVQFMCLIYVIIRHIRARQMENMLAQRS